MDKPNLDVGYLLREHITEKDEYILIHSALHRLRVSPDNIKWRFLRILEDLVRKDKTVVIPSFTFQFIKSHRFDWNKSPSEVGILGDWTNQLMDATRTKHPIYSMVCIGNERDRLLACSDGTAFGKNSLFDYLVTKNARLIMLGAEWNDCTLFHYFEEKHRVPYRYHKQFFGEIVEGDKTTPTSTSMYVRDLEIDPKNDFSKAIDVCVSKGLITTSRNVRSVQSVDVGDLASVCDDLLSKDKYCFVQNPISTEYTTNRKSKRAKNKPVRVLIYGSQNNDYIKSRIESEFRRYVNDRFVEVTSPAYGSHAKVLYQNGPDNYYDLVISVERYQDVVSEVLTSDCDIAMQKVREYIANIKILANEIGGVVIVNLFCLTQPDIQGVYGVLSSQGTRNIVGLANKIIVQELGPLGNVIFVDIDEISSVSGVSIVDERTLYHGRFPFGEEASRTLVSKWLGCFLAHSGRSIRLLVVDLDNTLWGGVIGEDGIKGISLGGDYPGNAYRDFQKLLKGLIGRGIALAIVSKNNETDALEAINKHKDMVLRISDFVSYRINWNDKATNILDIASELGLGLESIGFVDDSPVERELVRSIVPEVKVIDIGNDVARFSKILLTNPYLEVTTITDEDRKRSSNYLKRAKLAKAKNNSKNLEQFFRDLRVAVYIQEVTEYNFSRLFQLIQKTNQFNTTGERYSQKELEDIQHKILVIAASDKYSEREDLGVIIFEEKVCNGLKVVEIESFLLSCRALGKGIESGLIWWMTNIAKNNAVDKLVVRFRELERNKIVRQLFESLDWIKSEEGYECKYLDCSKLHTHWVQFVDEREVDQ